MYICVRKLERERELLLRLIVTRWVVEDGAVDGDGGWRRRSGVVCIVLYVFGERTVRALGRWKRGKETRWMRWCFSICYTPPFVRHNVWESRRDCVGGVLFEKRKWRGLWLPILFQDNIYFFFFLIKYLY